MTAPFLPRHERKISVDADANTEMSSVRSHKLATASKSAGPPQLWMAVHFPLLELDVFLPYWQRRREDHGSVVLQQNRVTAMSETAQQAGVRAGMRRGGVLMLLPTAKLFQRDLVRQKNALEAAAIALLRYTPQVAIAEEATIVLDIGASLRLFGGLRALRQHVRQTMEILGLHTTIACAPFAKAACILARDAARQHKSGAQCLHPQRLPTRLNGLPVSLLIHARPCLELLQGLACHTLFHLQQLPRAGVQRRFGKALLDELDQVYGRQSTLFTWVVAAPRFHASLELPDRLERSDMMLTYCHSLLRQLSGWLSVHRLAVKQIRLQLQHERGRQAVAPSILNIVMAEACWQDAHLLPLLKEKLAQFSLPSAVIALVLEAPETVALDVQSESLFPEPGGKPEDHQRLLALLVARLGEDHVLQAAPLADHRPEIANQWISVMQKRPAGAEMPAAALLHRPAWLLPQPLPLTLRQHRPYYRSILTIVSPTERIEAGWWTTQTQARDYFVATSADHVRYWIYRERSSDPESTAPRWFLHGVFG